LNKIATSSHTGELALGKAVDLSSGRPRNEGDYLRNAHRGTQCLFRTECSLGYQKEFSALISTINHLSFSLVAYLMGARVTVRWHQAVSFNSPITQNFDQSSIKSGNV